MSEHSGASTIPLTPPDFSDGATDSDSDAFALLRPINSDARKAFDAALNAVIKYDHRHLLPFFRAERRPSSPASVFSEIGDSESSTSMWTGSYQLSLNTLPRDPSAGWLMGTGRYAGGGDGDTDLLLAPPKNEWTMKGVAGKHAVVSFHPDSSRILIRARHSVTLGLGGAQILTGLREHVLEHQEILTIGSCVYTFDL